MVSYIASFAVSAVLGVSLINRRLNRKYFFMLGSVIGIMNCAFMHFQLPGIDIFGVATLIGITQAILLIASLGTTAELINKNTESGAFVYGAMSFVDKLANGIAYQIIEILNPSCNQSTTHTACQKFYRNVMVFVPGCCAIAILIVLLTLNVSSLGIRRRVRRLQAEEDERPILPEEELPQS